MTEPFPGAGSPRWKEARRTAFVQDALATLRQRSASLLSFEQVSRKLRLEDAHYTDIQEVPLDQIAGSVGRYNDFTRAFFPRTDRLQDRWEKIERVMAAGRAVPPVELYRVGDVFFVRDGNHRVSVARQLGRQTVKAHVWEYDTPLPLQGGARGVRADQGLARRRGCSSFPGRWPPARVRPPGAPCRDGDRPGN